MSWKFSEIYRVFSKKENFRILKKGKFGLERETLRTNQSGELSKKKHPKSLGSALCNPYITLDFSEAQLELNSPPCSSIKQSVNFSKEIHRFLAKNIEDELLWPFSMPCALPKTKEIPIADFGTSHKGQKATIYRRGLSYRYGRKMQTIAGIHYNFSFSEQLWELLYKKFEQKQGLSRFISDSYFKIIRNFNYRNWLNIYLFGNSPVCHRSFIKIKPRSFIKFGPHCYYGRYATSLRMSKYGYSNKQKCQEAICLKNLEEFTNDIQYAISTPKKAYKKIGLYKKNEQIQLNYNLFQIENEYYAMIRPKQIPKENESILEAINKRGVKYIEIRAVDLNPFNPYGIDQEYLDYLHIFLVYCLFKEAPACTKRLCCEVIKNQERAALYGRKAGLKLLDHGKKVTFNHWAEKILIEMMDVAKLFGKNAQNLIQKQIEKVKNPELTPSAQLIKELRKKDLNYIQFGIDLAKKNLKQIKSQELSKKSEQKFSKISKKSLEDQLSLECQSEYTEPGYQDLEISTQLLIKEAKKRKIEIEVLDRQDNFIKLSQRKKIEYIKQASKTSKDSYMTYLIMKNKIVTKRILQKNNIRVPLGQKYDDLQKAIEDYFKYSEKKLVVKPNSTNYGISINYVDPNKKKDFENAMKKSFKHDKSVIVEEFLPGKEYRFLVINKQVVAITHRRPASVLGDGVHSIKWLVEEKNKNPLSYKPPKYKINLGKTERAILAEQKMSTNSIPKKNQRVFLRNNSNISTGGDPIDMTDQIPDYYKKVAIKAAKTVKANICGVDMIIKNLKSKPGYKKYGIIELNFNPILLIHSIPFEGKKRNVAKHILDLLGFK